MKGPGDKGRRTAGALAAIAVLSAFLHLFGTWREGAANPYYAAAVQSMLLSWKNFFFASLDPTGFVSVDKPPLALWIQTVFARVLGFHDWVLILPQALAGVGCVLLMFRLVGRRFGDEAGLWASLFLALTPILPATSRNNTMDVLLLLFVLLAVERFFRALESGRTLDLAVCAFLLGAAFNVKMLQAFLPLPAFAAAWLIFSPRAGWAQRAGRSLVFTAVLACTSLAWILAVDLTPEGRRPYVGSSKTDSAMELAVGYNLKDRLHRTRSRLRPHRTRTGQPGLRIPAWMRGNRGNTAEFGRPGPFRILGRPLGVQVSWFLLLALWGAIVGPARGWKSARGDPASAEILFWSLWALTALAVFSFGRGILHRHYLVMLAPPLAALAAVAVARGMSWWRTAGTGGNRWAFPAVLASTAVLHFVMAWRSTGGGPWLVLASAGVFACILALAIFRPEPGTRPASRWLAGALFGLLLPPLAWSATPLFADGQVRFPRASFDLVRSKWQGTPATRDPVRWKGLCDLLSRECPEGGYAAAVLGAEDLGSELVLALKKPVLIVGGFLGEDPILTLEEFRALVAQGEVRYFALMEEEFIKARMKDMDPGVLFNREIVRWAVENGEEVELAGGNKRVRLVRIKDRVAAENQSSTIAPGVQ